MAGLAARPCAKTLRPATSATLRLRHRNRRRPRVWIHGPGADPARVPSRDMSCPPDRPRRAAVGRRRRCALLLAVSRSLVSPARRRRDPNRRSGAARHRPRRRASQKLDHLIFIVQENRSFDHYFGTYPGADGIPTKAERIVPVCVPDHDPAGRCAHALHDTGSVRRRRPARHAAAVTDVNGGRMDGFIRRVARLPSTCKAEPDDPRCGRRGSGPRAQPDVMGYHTRTRDPELLGVRRSTTCCRIGCSRPSDSWTLPVAPVPGVGLVGRAAPNRTTR